MLAVSQRNSAPGGMKLARILRAKHVWPQKFAIERKMMHQFFVEGDRSTRPWLALAAVFVGLVLAAGCGRAVGMTERSDGGNSYAEGSDATTETDAGMPEADSGTNGYPEVTCPERVLPALCRALPPECPSGTFPASDGLCWTGHCVDCIDGCQNDSECVVVHACSCSGHDGCAWVQSAARHALETNRCFATPEEGCDDDCPIESCPDTWDCGEGEPCCSWCSPNEAVCSDAGVCTPVTSPCD
jgi:hypothetical protein